MSDTNTIDLDAVLAANREQVLKNAVEIPFEFAGEKFRLTTAYNAAAMMAVLTPNAQGGEMLTFLYSCVHPDDRVRFQTALMTQEGFDGVALGLLANKMAELVTGRPTESSSDSSRTSRSRRSGTNSKATSSAPADLDLQL